MRATTAKSRGKRLDRSAQSRVDQTEMQINSVAKAKMALCSRVRCPNHGTARTKNLIAAQNSAKLDRKTFYSGNVETDCFLGRQETRSASL